MKTLTQEQIQSIHIETCAKALEKIKRKGKDYAGANGNSLVTLRMAASLGVHPVIGVLLRMFDKAQRIVSFVVKGELQVKDEPVEDAIEDSINYLILIKAIIAEDKLNQEDTK